MKQNVIFVIDFHGHDLRAFFLDGAIYFMARDVGSALGYADDGKRLVRNINADWEDEFDGLSRHVTNRDFGGADPAPLNNRGELALTKDGLMIATMKSGKPAGKALRRWLIKVAMPVIEKVAAGQLVSADERKLLGAGAAAVFGVAPKDSVPQIPNDPAPTGRAYGLTANQQRIALNQALKTNAITEQEYNRRMRALLGFGADPSAATAPTEKPAKTPLALVPAPVPVNHKRAREIAAELGGGMTDRKVHKLARKLGLRGEEHCHTRHESRDLPVYYYSDEAIERMRSYLAAGEGAHA